MDAIFTWLHEEIGLQPLGPDVERECANGFLFGRILHHYGLQPDLPSFINKSAPDAKFSNFQRLEPVFRALNIKFNSHIANQVGASAVPALSDASRAWERLGSAYILLCYFMPAQLMTEERGVALNVSIKFVASNQP